MRRKTIKGLSFLAGMYGAWVAVSFAVYGISRLLPQDIMVDPRLSSLLFSAAALFFLVVGFQLNSIYLVFAESVFKDRLKARLLCLAAVVAAAGLMFLAARHWLIVSPFFYMIYTANLIVFANLLGVWIITPLKREAEIIMVCVVMAIADLFSMLRGPTREIVEVVKAYYQGDMAGPPPAADFLLVKIPAFGLDHLQPLFGVSDWIIIVFLSAAAARFRINDNLAGRGPFEMIEAGRVSFYFPLAGAGLAAALFAAMLLNRFVPALPVIAACFAVFVLIRYPAARQLRRSDWLVLGVFCGIMLALLLLAVMMMR